MSKYDCERCCRNHLLDLFERVGLDMPVGYDCEENDLWEFYDEGYLDSALLFAAQVAEEDMAAETTYRQKLNVLRDTLHTYAWKDGEGMYPRDEGYYDLLLRGKYLVNLTRAQRQYDIFLKRLGLTRDEAEKLRARNMGEKAGGTA